MSIPFICSSCRVRIQAADGSEGLRVVCPHCNATIVVPGGLPADAEERSDPSRRERHYDEDEPRGRSRRVDSYEDDYDDRPARRRRRDDDYDDEDDRPRRRRFRCPYCGSDEPPAYRSEIAPAGWIVFGVCIFFCLPLCWIGLLINESYRVCRDCGDRLG